MRIIAGSLKGRRLEAPTWTGLRPTSDKLRETLFNILRARVNGARVLDGYAGSGALGLEALSRGAAHVTFIEDDGRACRLIERNAERCGAGGRCAIIRAAFERAAAADLPVEAFDLVLGAPPYEGIDLARVIGVTARLLASGGLLVLEHARRHAAPEEAGGLVRVREVASGDSALAFYERRDPRA